MGNIFPTMLWMPTTSMVAIWMECGLNGSMGRRDFMGKKEPFYSAKIPNEVEDQYS